MKQAEHPKDEPSGIIAWPRPTHYIVGDRVRHTVLFITDHYILEMTPAAASFMGNEILVHCRDVRESPADRPGCNCPAAPGEDCPLSADECDARRQPREIPPQ